MDDRGSDRVLVCRAGEERFAVPVSMVREVVVLPALTRIPSAPPAVRGLANVRGRLVTVLGGMSRNGFPAAGTGESLVVLRSRQGQLGLAVDEVEEVASAADTRVGLVDVEALVRGVMEGLPR